MTNSDTDKPVWLVRAGKHGQDEEAALQRSLAIIGFSETPDLSKFSSLQAVADYIVAKDPAHNPHSAGNRARQVWTFRTELAPGDLVVLPRKGIGQVAIGRVSGPYMFQQIDGAWRHTRPVTWLKPDVPRSVFQQDLLNSFGAFITVCEITRNEARKRVAAVLQTGIDPGFVEEGGAQLGSSTVRPAMPPEPGPDEAIIDIEQAAHDEIVAFVREHFQAHDMARLVEAILQDDGFVTHRAPPGPDGGADILAGKGALGLDGPTLCVQVKATSAPVDVAVFRGLQGSISSFGASQGLLVCWGGFTQPARNEARQHIFRIRLSDQTDLVRALYRNYEKLSEELQAELPLKRVWALVREDVFEE